MSAARTPLEEARLVGASPMFAAMREVSDSGKYKRLDADFMAAHWWEVWDALLVSLARIKALEQVRFAAQSLVAAQIADGHSRRTAWANLRAALRGEEGR